MTDPSTIVITVPERRRYQWWRDVVILLLIATVLLLANVMRVQGDRSDERYRAATAQRSEQTSKIDALAADVARLTRDNAAKDTQIAGQAQTIRMLTAILLREGISIPADLQQRVDAGTAAPTTTASPRPSTTPAPSSPTATPAPVAPTPQPSPTDTSLVGGVTSLLCLLVPFAC